MRRHSRWILILASAALVAGCGGKEPMVAEDVEAQAYEDLRQQITETIDDPQRAEAVLEAVQRLVDEYVEMRRFVAERRENLRRLNADYDATREQFHKMLDSYDEQLRTQRRRVLDSVKVFQASMSADEWEELVKINTYAMKQFMTVLENV